MTHRSAISRLFPSLRTPGDLLRTLGPAIVLAVVFALVVSIAPGILKWRAVNALLFDAAPLLILVIGSTLPVLLGCIDLSAAAMASLAAVVAALLMPVLGSAAVPAVILGAGLIGALQGWLIGRLQIPSFVMTLGTLGVFSGLALYLSNASTIGIGPGLGPFDFLGGRTAGMPNAFLTVLAVWVVLALVLRFTRAGRDVYAFGASELAAYMSGVGRDTTRAYAFAISSMCAALGGLMLLSQTLYSAPTMASNLLLPALVGVVVGGTAISGGVGGLSASLIGGLTAVMVRVGTTIAGLPGAAQDVAFGVIILIAVAVTTDRSKIGIVK
ncbi:MAG: ABC transporter permease [Rhizobiaceae bacterium]|nr:ABC transporter permease [Rhizobiaceae bacterium]